MPSKLEFVCPDEDMKQDEIIGVKVMSLNEAPNPFAKHSQPLEETKELQPELVVKKKAKKASLLHRDEGAFQTYIFRVCKEVCPDSGVSKKAMTTLNQMMADKFETLMNEARGLVINQKKGTLTSKEIETACRLMIKGELG